MPVLVDQCVQQFEASSGLGDDGAHMLAGEVDRLAEQLRSPAREVVIGRAARCAAVLENVRDRGGMGATLPDQQRGGDDHPLAWVTHMYDAIHNRRAYESPPRKDAESPYFLVKWAILRLLGEPGASSSSRLSRRSWGRRRRWSSSR